MNKPVSVGLCGVCAVALCGAVGGAVNAWLCYARLPVPLEDSARFAWHLIPAGAGHGALLAAVAFGSAALFAGSCPALRLLAAPLVAWLAGFLSWIPLNRSAFDEPWPKSLSWPFHEGWGHMLGTPFISFGLVALLYYLALSNRRVIQSGAAGHAIAACAAGVLGSLWWWIVWQRWYFCLLHGAIWGTAVGAGAWRASRAEVERPKSEVRSVKSGD